MIQYIVGDKIISGVLTYRDNFSVVWKTMLSVFCLRLFFLPENSFFATFSQYFWMYLSTY